MTTILSGGTEITENLASAISTTVGSGGLLDTLFGGTIVSAVISGGTVTVGNAASFGGNLTFAGSGGVLEFETDTMPTAVISGLVPGDFLLFDNATFGPGATVTLTSGSPDVLSATLDGTHYTLHLDSSVSYAGFAFDAIPTTNVHLLAAFPMATAIEVVSVSSVGAGSSTSGGSLGLGQAQRVLGATLSLTVGNGGEQGVNHGGTANNTFVDVGGVQLVSSGGIAISAAVDGIQFIFAGGSAANAAITESGAQEVLGTATSTTVSGTQYVGGKASATTIATFGFQFVISGGTAVGTTDAWEQQVRSAGTAISTTITSDGFQDVEGGAVAISTTVLNGGEQDVSGKASATIVSNGGYAEVEVLGVLSGAIISNGGLAFVKAAGTATGAVIDGGTLELAAGASLGTGAVTFGTGGSDGRLTFDGTPLSNTISGFAAGDTIDLAGVGFARGNTVTSAGGVVTVSAGTSHFTVHLAPSGLAGGTFHLKPDGNEDTTTGAGGTVIGHDQFASIASGQTSTNISVGDAHVQIVQSDATALGMTVANGGEQDVFGTASGTVLNGTEVVYGRDSGARIGFFGLQYIYSGGTATGATVSGGLAEQEAYGTASGTTVLAGGALFVGAKGSSVNAVIGNGGTERVASGGSAIGTTISGSGVMEAVDGGVLGSGTSLTFAGTGGTLQVDDTTMPTAVISGFAPGDTLAFIGLGQILTPDVSVTGVTLLPNNALQLTTQDIFFDISTYYLQLDPLQNFNGEQFDVEIGRDALGFPGSVEIFLSGPSGPVVSGGTTFVSNGVTSTGVFVGAAACLSSSPAVRPSIRRSIAAVRKSSAPAGVTAARRSPAANRTCSAPRAA